MLILYTRLLDQPRPPSPQKNSVNPQTSTPSNQKNLSRKAHEDAVEHLNQVKTNYSLYRRFIV